ncbi:MAG: penicillin-binding protein activator [Deltaproteobacteria bacterium]|nr:penicillin-binding protein activator [Deltaproteobacteria bacterium]
MKTFRPSSRPQRHHQGFTALLLLLGLFWFSGVANAQSILSHPPELLDLGLPLGAKAVEAQSKWYLATLEELFKAVEAGEGPAVFAPLKSRMEDELERVRAAGKDVPALRARYLAYLIRAGERLLAPEAMETLAGEFVETYPDSEFFPMAFFQYNQARFQRNKPLVESFFFDQSALDALPSAQRGAFMRLRSASAERRGALKEAAELLLSEMERDSGNAITKPAEVEELLERLGDPLALEAVIKSHSNFAWLLERAPFLRIRVFINAGQMDKALLALNNLEAGSSGKADEIKFFAEARAAIKARVNTHANRIGVLLPISSTNALLRELSRETLDGLRMAIQFPGSPEHLEAANQERRLGIDLAFLQDPATTTHLNETPAFELVVRDTANNPKNAAALVETLVKEDQVIAIIGPLARNESEAAAEKAETLGVPLISFSVSLDLPPRPRYIFRHSMSQETEVRELVRFAMDYMEVRRFAILYPETGYGRYMMSLFWDEVKARNGQVMGAASFVPSARRESGGFQAVGFKDIFENFTGLKRAVSPEDQKLMTLVGDSNPDPIVDFDALFIPTDPSGLADLQQIAPYPVTVNAEDVVLLGSRFWNDDAVIVAGDTRLENAVFVDVFDRTSTNPKVAAFHNRHRTYFGHRGNYRSPTYYTALAYDSASLLMTLLADPQNRGRDRLTEAMHTMKPFPGVTGMTTFNENGESEKESMFFQIRGSEIQRFNP